MRTLADLKRALTVGRIVRLDWSRYPHKYVGQERTVNTVQTNAVTFKLADGNESWLYFDKAANYIFTDTGFTVLEKGQPLLSYTIL